MSSVEWRLDRDREKAMKKKITALTLCAIFLALGFSATAQTEGETLPPWLSNKCLRDQRGLGRDIPKCAARAWVCRRAEPCDRMALFQKGSSIGFLILLPNWSILNLDCIVALGVAHDPPQSIRGRTRASHAHLLDTRLGASLFHAPGKLKRLSGSVLRNVL